MGAQSLYSAFKFPPKWKFFSPKFCIFGRKFSYKNPNSVSATTLSQTDIQQLFVITLLLQQLCMDDSPL